MTPTAKLRWVERAMPLSLGAILYQKTQKVRVLQQWWEIRSRLSVNSKIIEGEWRDVPLEEET